MSPREELADLLQYKGELQTIVNAAKKELKELTYKKIGARFGKSEDSVRYFARKLHFTSGA